MGVDLDNLDVYPSVRGYSSHGGYCGPAVKPIALNLLTQVTGDSEVQLPVSGIGGIETWKDAAEFLLLGASGVQVCTAVMHYGYRIVEDLVEGLSNYMDDHGYAKLPDMVGKALHRVKDWGDLDLNFKVVAVIDEDKCIKCNLCHIACEDGAHQCIEPARNGAIPVVDEKECVGCNLCMLVCPVDNCITMKQIDKDLPQESWRQRQARLAET